ncbi:MAG: hypothetical protein ACF8PG_01965 [Maioricimonas sp. JB045]
MTALAICPPVSDAAHPAVERNRETLEEIESYYLSMTQSIAASEDEDAPLEVSSIEEVWSSGPRYRRRTRSMRVLTADGLERVTAPHGHMHEFSVSPQTVRNMAGWDPEHPPQTPLQFGRNAREFGSIDCSIAVTDPTARHHTIERGNLLWEIAPGWSLADVADVAELEVVSTPPDEGESLVRLRIVSAENDGLREMVGTVIDVDLEHGGFISRIERRVPPEDRVAVSRVTRFEKTDAGTWMPMEVLNTINGRRFMQSVVNEYRINAPIPDDQLLVQFPEGARVDDTARNVIHLWGKGEPAETFASYNAFMTSVYAAAREQQRPKGARPLDAAPQDRWRTLLLLNLALVSILAACVALRMRLRRAGQRKPPRTQELPPQ